MSEAIRISAVSYLNTKPFLFGLERFPPSERHTLVLDHPARCAEKLITRSADLGLVPVAAMPQISNAQIVGNHCIASDGSVRTVSLFSEVPLEKITRVYLDIESRTSVALLQILLAEFWQISPVLVPGGKGIEKRIEGTSAALVIGDRAIPLLRRHPCAFDLAATWKAFTGLPFVFACWVSTHSLSPQFTQSFEKALAWGVRQRSDVARVFELHYPGFNVNHYFNENICFTLDERKRQALSLFLAKSRALDERCAACIGES